MIEQKSGGYSADFAAKWRSSAVLSDQSEINGAVMRSRTAMAS